MSWLSRLNPFNAAAEEQHAAFDVIALLTFALMEADHRAHHAALSDMADCRRGGCPEAMAMFRERMEEVPGDAPGETFVRLRCHPHGQKA